MEDPQRLGIEPLNHFESDRANRAEDAIRMIEAIGHPSAGVSLDSFRMNIGGVNFCKAVAEAVCIWRRFAASQDEFASNGLEFQKEWYA